VLLLCRRLLPALLLAFLTARAAAAAEAVVRYNGSDIADSASINFNAVNIGSSVTRNYTFHNIGADGMTGISFSLIGAHAADYTLSAPSTMLLAPGGSISFSITFRPAQPYARTAMVNITNSDPNENPYNLNLSGTGVAPEINVIAGAVPVADGGTLTFGNVRLGLSGVRLVNIQNTGNAALTNLSLSLSGSDFTVTPLGVTSLAPGASKTITVTFTPEGTFQSTGTLRILSNDANESPYDINLTGTGVLPLLDVESPPGSPVSDGAETLLLSGTAGQPVLHTLLLRNVSAFDITGLALSLDGPDAANFTAGPLPADTLAPGATLTFTLTFTPPAPGDSVAALHISMDQAPGNPFDIPLLGTGLTLPDTGDEDLDGTPNMLEIATGHDPLTPGPAPGVLTMNGAQLEFTFHRLVASLNDTVLTVEWADDPAGAWTTLDNSSGTLLSDDGILQELRYTLPAGSSGRRCLRLRATRVAP